MSVSRNFPALCAVTVSPPSIRFASKISLPKVLMGRLNLGGFGPVFLAVTKNFVGPFLDGRDSSYLTISRRIYTERRLSDSRVGSGDPEWIIGTLDELNELLAMDD